MIRADQSAVDVEKLIACVFMESGEIGPSQPICYPETLDSNSMWNEYQQ
jgi:hypothetical protein